MTQHRNPAYTEEYRREAVRRSELPDQSTASVAKELGISAQQIYNWKRQFNRLSDKQFNSLNGVDCSKPDSEEKHSSRIDRSTGLVPSFFVAWVVLAFLDTYEGRASIESASDGLLVFLVWQLWDQSMPTH